MSATEREAYFRRVADSLEPDGQISKTLPAFVRREGQLGLGRAVAQAIADRSTLVAEAGTGIGKTFAYLVPALLSGGMVLVSTGTRNLQDQLFKRDLPKVSEALQLGRRVALLKGRANYVCRYHLRRNLDEGRFERREDITVLHRIDRFAAVSSSGDRSEAPGIAEDLPVWSKATSTRENCLGQDCPDYSECFVFKARHEAQQADIVVVNHHLLCADMALRDEGIADLLPSAQAVILDEAHQLPEVATQFFGRSVSSRQLIDLARDSLRAGIDEAPDAANWVELSRSLEQSLRPWRLSAPTVGRIDRDRLSNDSDFQASTFAVLDAVRALRQPLQSASERGREIARLAVRSYELERAMSSWLTALAGSAIEDERTNTLLTSQAGESAEGPSVASAELGRESDAVLWVDAGASSMAIHATPLSLAATFQRQREASPRAWVFVSATLSLAGDFSHFTSVMGLDDARCERWDSPFDMWEQAALYVPQGCGDPGRSEFAAQMVQAIWPLLEANRGRAFILCTSLRMVEQLAAHLNDKVGGVSSDIKVLVQGTAPRNELLALFRESPNPVLIGSASFWEGVDVVGEQLSLVVIDKLPFVPPDDPVLKARSDALKRAGGDPFNAIQLPAAAMALKQGAGRLIRSERDSGLLVICDERIVSRGYGKRLRASLPAMPLTRSADEALAWVRHRTPVASKSTRQP